MGAAKHIAVRMLVGLAVMMVLPLAACTRRSEAGADVPALLAPEQVTLDTAVVKRGDFYRIKQYRAFLRAYTQEVYFGDTRLNIKKIDVRAGQDISKGDKIAELDAEELEKAIAEQEEAIRYLKMAYDHENRMKQYDIDIAGLRNQASELDGGGQDRELARIEMQKQINALTYQRETQRLELQRQEERLEELRAELELTVITAPFDGVVVYVDELWEGSPAIPFQAVAYVADPSQIFVEYNGSDYFPSGGEITAEIGDKTYDLEYIPLDADEQLKYVLDGRVPPARLNILGDTEGLTPGMFAAVYVKTEQREDTLLVPVNSIHIDLHTDLGAYVYVMEDGVKELRQVKTGVRNESEAEILEGLAEGEEVFVKQ